MCERNAECNGMCVKIILPIKSRDADDLKQKSQVEVRHIRMERSSVEYRMENTL